LAQRLRDKHGVHVLERDQQALGALHRYDQANRVLAVAAHLRPNQQAFRLAAQLALIEFEPLLGELADEAGLIADEVRSLTIIGLANYFAAATMLPYEKFRVA